MYTGESLQRTYNRVELMLIYSMHFALLFYYYFKVMMQILKDMGVTEYEPRVINQMLEFTYSKSEIKIDPIYLIMEHCCIY